MGLYVFPLTPGQVNPNLKAPLAVYAWESSLDDFMQTAKDDLDKFMVINCVLYDHAVRFREKRIGI
jgi:hypothetical protein